MQYKLNRVIREGNNQALEVLKAKLGYDNDKINMFMNPIPEYAYNPNNLTNLRKSYEIIKENLRNDKKILILVDCDVDGLTSAAQLCIAFPTLQPIFHSGKQHGLEDEEAFDKIVQAKPDLLIIPDAGSNDVEELKELSKTMDIIILDHHPINEGNQKIIDDMGVVLVNPERDDNLQDTTNLTGAGVARLLIKCGYRDLRGFAFKNMFLDALCALGQIGDASDISSVDVNYMIRKGLKHMRTHDFISLYIEDIKHRDISPKDLSYSIISAMNSVCRAGTLEEKEMLFEAICRLDYLQNEIVVQRKRKNKTTNKFEMVDETMTGFQDIKDKVTKVKARQDSQVKKLITKIEKEELSTIITPNIAIIVVDESTHSIAGLVANKLKDKYQKPTLVVRQVTINGESVYAGSVRSDDKYTMNFKSWCSTLNEIKSAEGHENAFGIQIKADKLNDFIKQCEHLPKQDCIYNVDLILDEVDDILIRQFDTLGKYFGGAIEQPKLAYDSVEFNRAWFKKRGRMVTFFKNGVEFVMYRAPEDFDDKFRAGFGDSVYITLVGEPSINIWNGSVKYQVVIDDMEFVTPKPKEIDLENFVF